MKTRHFFFLIILMLGFAVHRGLAETVAIKANDDVVTGIIVRSAFTISNLNENDTVSGGPIFLYAVSTPLNGKAEVRPGNAVIYTPRASFKGEDTFLYAISTGPNGIGATSVAKVTVRNPYLLYRGTYTGSIVGVHQIHEDTGYFVITVDAQGHFTSTLRFAGQAYPFKGVFDSQGHYTATIARDAPLSNLTLDIQFPLEGPAGIQCQLGNGAENTPFTASRILWSSTNRPTVEGRYSVTLPAPDTNKLLTPQGSGYAIFTIGKTGTVSIVGRTGDSRSFTMSSKLRADNTIPFYIGLYRTAGSIFGDVALTRVNASKVTAAGNLTWTKLKNIKDKLYPKGFIRSLAARGATYTEPKANTNVLSVTTNATFNSSLTVAAGILRLPRTERALLGIRPDNGRYAVAFDNSRRLRAEFSINPRTGVFSGSFFDVTTHKKYRMSGVVVQGDNKAYGLWNSVTRTGSIVLQPDALPVP